MHGLGNALFAVKEEAEKSGLEKKLKTPSMARADR